METLTLLFTDIEGSTSLLRRAGETEYGRILTGHHELIRTSLAAYGGRELNTMGDGFFAGFTSPRQCAAAMLEMQRVLEAHAWPAGERVRVRMGAHTGEATQTPATGVLGLDVHRAARIAAVAHGGQIVLSETAAALMRDSLPPGATLKDLGTHRLKDLGRAEQIFQLSGAGLQTDFPPLHSLGNPELPNNLPVQPTTFVGRIRELAEVRELLESSRLVTLTGAGGSGKTRLGLRAAAESLDGTDDGAWLAELAAVIDEEAVAPAVCAALGISVRPGHPAPDALTEALAAQRVLIILDNCEHLIGACAKIADAILRHCPRVRLLATSREPLGIGGETVYRVPSMSLPEPGDCGEWPGEPSDAVALFMGRAAERGVVISADEQTGPLVLSICRRLDGMPLAIELATGRLSSLSLSELRDRLDHRFGLLTGGSRVALKRQQTLQATVEWSYSLLGSAEQQLLRRLSVFADGFNLRAAERVCGFGDMGEFDVAALLGSLVDKSLVVAEPAGDEFRYRLLETIRQFAAERLAVAADGDRAASEARHSEYFLSVAERAAPHLTGPDQGKWFAALQQDNANLWRAARQAAGDPAGTSRALRFGAALGRFWQASDQDLDAYDLLTPVLERAGDDVDPRLVVDAMMTATAAGRAVNWLAARRLGGHAIELARQLGDERLVIESLAVVCSNYYFSGEAEIGIRLGAEAVERAARRGDDILLGESLMAYLLCNDVIDPRRSEELFAEAFACIERSGDLLTGYVLHNNAGVHALRAGQIADARAHLEQAARSGREIGERSHHVEVNLGWVLRAEGVLDEARSKFAEGLRLSRRSGEQAGLAYSVLGLACVETEQGDARRAGKLHGIAQALLDAAGEPWQEPEVTYREASLGSLRALLGDQQFDEAYGEGMALRPDDAFDLAIGRTRQA